MKKSLLLVLSSLGLFALKSEAAPVGMAAFVKGPVSVSNNGVKKPLRLLGRLEDGATVSCGPGASAVVLLFGSGQRFQVGANKSASVNAAGVQGGQRLAELSGPSAGAVKLLGSARVGAAASRPAKSLQRLVPTSPGYIDSAKPRFEWIAVPDASRYTFTLFDDGDNVVWTTTTDQPGVSYPASAPPLSEKKPYLWTLSAFRPTGKAILNAQRGGLITFLSSQDARTLESLATELQSQAKNAADSTPLILLAELCLSYGVTGRALEVLEDEGLAGDSGVAGAKADIYASLSPFARVLAGPDAETAGLRPE